MQIPIEQRIIAVIFSVILVAVTVQLIRKRKLREEYALSWLAASISILVLSVFGELVTIVASMLSVTYAPALIFAVGILFAVVVLLSQSVALSSQADCIRDLAQKAAILEWQVQELKEKEQPKAGKLNGTNYELRVTNYE